MAAKATSEAEETPRLPTKQREKRRSRILRPKVDEEHRHTLRHALCQELIERFGGPRAAFKALDVNGSGALCYQELVGGMDSLKINWHAITGLRKPKDLMSLFDKDKDGAITITEMFSDLGDIRLSTAEFLRRYASREDSWRSPMWQASGSESGLNALLAQVEKDTNADDAKKEIQASYRRLKSNGKSDARCREILASHLPRGTGPRFVDNVASFSKYEVASCKKEYTDKVGVPLRKIQKAVSDMKDQRKSLASLRQKLSTTTRAGGLAEEEGFLANAKFLRMSTPGDERERRPSDFGGSFHGSSPSSRTASATDARS